MNLIPDYFHRNTHSPTRTRNNFYDIHAKAAPNIEKGGAKP